MKKQTAVEWLVEQILQKVQNYRDGDIETKDDPFIIEYVNRYNFNVDLTKFVEQAKEMEKEQIQDAFYYGVDVDSFNVHSPYQAAEQYYKETYESNN